MRDLSQIKFRGWSEKLYRWLYGSLLVRGDKTYILAADDMEEDGHHLRQATDEPLWVKPETVGQFTGMRDRHGVEIYEGDIVNLYTEPWHSLNNMVIEEIVVDFNSLCFCNMQRFAACDESFNERLEVIGDVHSTPFQV